jgi:branched-subunit amino acid ABC-type transport system permease component
VLLAAALVGGGTVSGLIAMAMERLAYRPLRRRGSTNRLVPLITAIGVSFFLQDFVRLIEGLWHNEFYLNYPSCPRWTTRSRCPGHDDADQIHRGHGRGAADDDRPHLSSCAPASARPSARWPRTCPRPA